MGTNDQRRDINSVAFTGELTFDAETRTTKSGKTLTKLRVMIRNSGAHFVRVTLWEDEAEKAKHFQKGDHVSVSGRLTYSEWDGKNGKQSALEVTADDIALLESGDDAASRLSGMSSAGEAAQRFIENSMNQPAVSPNQTTIQF